MATNGKRASSPSLEDSGIMMPSPTWSAKRPKVDSSIDAHGNHQSSGTARDLSSPDFHSTSTFTSDSLDHATIIPQLVAKLSDIESKISQMNPTSRMDILDDVPDSVYVPRDLQRREEAEASRKPATAMLNRCNWVEFKNLYLEEDTYAIDVLMGDPKFYWQRRAEEREMRDRIETAKLYSSEAKVKALEDDRKKTGFNPATGQTDGARPNGDEMPERIRINSKPLLAILSEIADEKWGDESKVMLRPYKLLVAHHEEIRDRHRVLRGLWAKRNKPDDLTIAVGAIPPTYEPETLDDDHLAGDEGSIFRGQHSINSLGSHERRALKKLDLTSTYDALQDLTILLEFIDVDILPIVKRYLPDSPSLDNKIHFRDLWYLYRPGDWVVLDERRGKRFSPDASCDDERPSNQPVNIGERVATLWRVLRTANGRPKLSPPHKTERNRQPASEVNPFSVRCYRIDYDGDRFGPIWVDFDFQPWVGEKPIEQLEIVPMRLTKNRDELWQRFVKRGKKFLELRTPQHRIYSGPLVNHHPSGLIYEHVAPGQKDVYGSVIIDFKETARMHPNMVLKLGFAKSYVEYDDDDLTIIEDYPLYAWEDRKAGRWKESLDDIYNDSAVDERLRHEHVRQDPFLSQFDSLLQGDYIDGHEFTDNELALLPVRVCAYILQRRRFALLRIDGLRDQGPEKDNWDDLHLHRDNKETVRAQTMSHFRNKALRKRNPEMRFDLSQEKGMGLVILLHGVPGVGKTSAAECVAQLLGKPLFPITCGDLGTTANEVDTQLNEIFNKAEKWDCILLLDEADVFLASRDKGDIHRNAVVSVFLRILELYTGILFLTTNRIGVLDEAFMSRCHTQLYYPQLDEDQTVEIWKTNLKRLQKRKGASINIASDRVLSFAREHFHHSDKNSRWNGRQIRNACQAAAALAEHDVYGSSDFCESPAYDPSQALIRLDVEHFKRVDNAMREFHEYMTNVTGGGFGDLAEQRGERNDDFQPSRRQLDPPRFVHSPQMGFNEDSSNPFNTSRQRSYYPSQEPPREQQRWSSFGRDRGPSFGGDIDRPQWSPH